MYRHNRYRGELTGMMWRNGKTVFRVGSLYYGWGNGEVYNVHEEDDDEPYQDDEPRGRMDIMSGHAIKKSLAKNATASIA
jgi:hypothetical protein